jgi:metaxin
LQTLRAAATAEILKTTRRPLLLPAQLYGDAGTAFEALDTLLGADEWFFGASEPGLFDADVFAYTYLILDPAFGWEDDSLRECLASCHRLISHRERLYARCWQ